MYTEQPYKIACIPYPCACILFANGFFNDSVIIFNIQIQIKFMIFRFHSDMQIIIIINYAILCVCARQHSNFYEYKRVYMVIIKSCMMCVQCNGAVVVGKYMV